MDAFDQFLADLHDLRGITIAFLVLSCIAVALRVYARAGILRTFGADDWTMLLTLACFITVCGTTLTLQKAFISILNGEGSSLSMKDLIILIRLDTGFYVLTMIVLKISLGLFFLRVFTASNWQRIIIYTMTAATTFYGLVCFIMTVGTCGASSPFFTAVASSKSTCTLHDAYSGVSTSWNILNLVTDFIYALLPIITLWNVNLPKRTKMLAGILLVFATMGGIASCIRVALLFCWPGLTVIDRSLRASYWTIIEMGVGIVVTAAATFRPLFRECIERGRHTSRPNAGTRGTPSASTSAQTHPAGVGSWKDTILSKTNELGSKDTITRDQSEMEESEPVYRAQSLQTHNLA